MRVLQWRCFRRSTSQVDCCFATSILCSSWTIELFFYQCTNRKYEICRVYLSHNLLMLCSLTISKNRSVKTDVDGEHALKIKVLELMFSWLIKFSSQGNQTLLKQSVLKLLQRLKISITKRLKLKISLQSILHHTILVWINLDKHSYLGMKLKKAVIESGTTQLVDIVVCDVGKLFLSL